jgi:molybdopterin-containing oxidoreductase family iron-sulfur binding subunit
MAIGKNVFHHTSFVNGVISYNVLNADVSKTGNTYEIATTQTSHTLMERDSVLRETTWSIYKAGNKDAYNPEHTVNYYGKEKNVKDVDLWTSHPIETIGHRWVMTIDLNTCIGCSNCVISCHSENNVPVVGKDEVRRSRDMHWLRIDRYYSSDTHMEEEMEKGKGTISTYSKMEIPSDNPQVLFQPMLCQHCNHAPCETVCPVLATTHSKEGLNQMTYNRCIGTRYCANNCPYKVRRFNWFNYQDYKKFKHSNPAADDNTRWVLNPDVTVRSRGVMEKCSFCVQRIQEGKLNAKKEARMVIDGEIQTACSSACPTNAIQFGDWNDTESQVRKNSQTPRAYMALEEVGIQPNIYYMVKVRNTEETKLIQKRKMQGGHHEHHEQAEHKEEKNA